MIALERLNAAEFPGRLPELQTAGHAAVITGMFPDTLICDPVRSAVSVTVTARVVPCSVSWPCAV